jgi:putative transposase
METFFSLLQKNVLDRRRWDTREQLRIAIVTWIERTYHRRRGQAALGRLTPRIRSNHDHTGQAGRVAETVTYSCSRPVFGGGPYTALPDLHFGGAFHRVSCSCCTCPVTPPPGWSPRPCPPPSRRCRAGAASHGDLGSGRRDGRPRPNRHRRWDRHLICRPALTAATRQQREHQRPSAPRRPGRHRPLGTLRRLPRRGRRRTQQLTPQTLRLPQPDPSPQPAPVRPDRNQCCNPTLNSPSARPASCRP